MNLDHAKIFVEVVRTGTFTAAAHRLRIPKSTVSARVKALEERLGAQLLKRTTRNVVLTFEGEAYFHAVAAAVDMLSNAEAAIVGDRGVLSGVIRFTAPLDFPVELLNSAICDFCRDHPHIRFDIRLTNDPVDMVTHNIDLALRGGEPAGRDMVVRKVGRIDFGLFASPAYFDGRIRPRSIGDLCGHDMLHFDPGPSRGATARLAVPGGGEARIISDSYAQLAALATEGMGIACLPSPIAARGLETGLLERIEAGWEPPSANLYLVYPTRRDMSARVKAFAAHLTALLARSN
ncbi:LysR family transcriptional regulator [Sphingopyxis sp. DHUNG17]|uniref:LysR family transcriptional regulator n=1 Tax=Sphingopyxis jiangsuensis TaxID=2871171 RepID=UPI00192014DE|nr:LysR family transcriptional regulator [Sphingopyxis lutea]MBL0768516.1 LysR family transcriptional regulator [Sphingopyxis lutea]